MQKRPDLLSIDVAIIGCSSSGLYAAQLLAEAGKDVAVFDRAKEIEPARRTYIITGYLRQILPDLPESALLYEVDSIEVESLSGNVSIGLRQPDLIVERSALVKSLSKRAEQAGAKLYLGHSFLGRTKLDGQLCLQIGRDDGEELLVRAPVVLGADGAFSAVGEAFGIDPPPLTSLVQAEVALPDAWDPKVVKVWFDRTKTEYFFWLIPESDSTGVLGLVVEPGTNPRRILDEFLGAHNIAANTYQAGKASMYLPRRKIQAKVDDVQVFLVGDAAGHVKVTTVGGTVSGFRGVIAAVEAILTGRSYKRLNRANNQELFLHFQIRRLLDRMSNQDYDQLLDLFTPEVVRFLGTYNRDAMAGKFLRLVQLQPRFALIGIKLVMRLLTNVSAKASNSSLVDAVLD